MAFDEREEGAHQRMVRLIGNNKKVLEIGSGQGFVSERLKANGCKVTAIEIDKEKAEQAKKICEKVLVGNVETMGLNFGEGSFDAILFGDVLEHLKEPEAALKKVKPFLAENGFIVVSLPNIANWKVRLKLLLGKFDYAEWGIMDKTHLRFFTKKTATGLIEKAGYKIGKEEFVPSFPFPFFKKTLSKINPNAFAFQFIFSATKK